MKSFFTYENVVSIVLAVLTRRLILWLIKLLWDGFRSDLRNVPGPVLSRFTHLPLKLAVMQGRRSLYIHALHEQYGSYVRISPDEVHTADIAAFRTIHRVGSDWNKGNFYEGQLPSQMNDETAGVFGIQNNKTASPRRRLFQSAGTQKIVVEWEPQVKQLTALALQKITHDLRTRGASDVMKWWTLMASDITGSLAFGESFHNTENGERNRLVHDVEMLMPIIGVRTIMPWTKPIMDAIPTCYGKDAVQATRAAQQGGGKTLFSKMVLDDESEQAIPDSLIEKEATNVIVAGTDTTAMTLTYLVYAVLKNPDVKRKLVEEMKTCSTDPKWEELESKSYLNNVIQETMRTHPAVPGTLVRKVPPGGENALKYRLPAGTEVGTQAWTFHHDPSVFEDPFEFKPERWDDPTLLMKEYMMPFGGPTRMCVGRNIARMSLLHATAVFFRECPDVGLAESTTEASMEMVDYFAIKPRSGKCVVVSIS
ncbi:sterigmatocystin biosynthesis P450 monooxygenase [Setomelanomma holmii]|uniref:Sterigmatocystin biosynthesis P450 monooxygenase n=1 Tax=Setomelanomma holmii TaxID=210430 RepID=A0A9P4H6A7_9PLEO|nr:sterigmatocystin biosynthesis P450 monooxygenase [Setomelanomma holmii]